jgi:Lhr-like helicase
MPRGRGLRGASTKEKGQYEHIKKSAQRSGRYGKRAKEVAARTVMKQRRKKGRTKRKKR